MNNPTMNGITEKNLTEREASEYLNVSPFTLRNWRFARRGLKYQKLAQLPHSSRKIPWGKGFFERFFQKKPNNIKECLSDLAQKGTKNQSGILSWLR